MPRHHCLRRFRIADCGLRIADCGLRIADCGLIVDELSRARDDAVKEGFPESINPKSAIRNPQSKSAGLLEIRLHQPDSFESGQRSHLGIYLAHKRAIQW